MTHTLLFVDDETEVLELLNLLFQRTGHHVLLARSGEEGLETLRSKTVSLIISDQRMPGMLGSEFLAKAREIQPEAVRIMLTGYSDVHSAMQAINEGGVYRFLPKPWDNKNLLATVNQALSDLDMRRENAFLQETLRQKNEELEAINRSLERKVLERTNEIQMALDLSNALNNDLQEQNHSIVEAFVGVIDLRNPNLGAHCRRVAGFIKPLCARLGASTEKQIHDMVRAALLHDLGKIGLPDSILSRDASQFGANERKEVEKHAILGEGQLQVVSGMAATALMVRHHHENVDGTGYPDGLANEQIPLGARVLRVVDAYDNMTRGGARKGVQENRAIQAMDQQLNKYFDAAVFKAFLGVLDERANAADANLEVRIPIGDLANGMVLSRDLRTLSGVLLAAQGEKLSSSHLKKISNFMTIYPTDPHAFVIRDA